MNRDIRIIQGGMGVGVSGWPLARAVARRGQLGVVSGTGIAAVMGRRLQQGDAGGHIRRALAMFPVPAMAERILARYYVAGGIAAGVPAKLSPMPLQGFSPHLAELTVLANFVEVYLAKEGHSGVVGINYLEKLQMPTLASIYGAMLAGVDYVLMGAGIPRWIPGSLDLLCEHRAAEIRMDVEGAAAEAISWCRFDPVAFGMSALPPLHRPKFLAIVSSATLAMTLARKSNGRVDGFVVEGPTAGGHNAPPRGPRQNNERGEPIYGTRDEVDLPKIKDLGLPFWMAGGYCTPEKIDVALAAGAAGVQVGTAFAFCQESALSDEIKRRAIAQSRAGTSQVFTDPLASPTGFPFKVLPMEGTLSDADVYAGRQRLCDIGYLRRAYQRADGTLGYRCPAEPVEDYVAKGGARDDTVGRKCLCNALFAAIGLGQVSASGEVELPLVTAGDEANDLSKFIPVGQDSYSAQDVLEFLLKTPQPAYPAPLPQASTCTSIA
jgi:nitronate monooxygenase